MPSYRDPPPRNELRELLALGSDAIEIQERRGQDELVHREATRLPFEGSDTKEALESPIVWGKRLQEDPLFRQATLPPGWKLQKSPDHVMWSYLLDHKGCRRARVFYKAACYDCKATIDFSVRYYVSTEYHKDGKITFSVLDTGQGRSPVSLYADTPELPDRDTQAEEHYKESDKCRAKAKAWLKKRFPNHEDPNAYWDTTPAS